MLEQARDRREEGVALHAFLETLAAADWQRTTPFKQWTPHEVVAHLHMFDRMSLLALDAPADYLQAAEELMPVVQQQTAEADPAGLMGLWYDCCMEMCDRLGAADPKARLKWFGPDMGVRMFTTARQMETWAHGQDIYDLMRAPRTHTDRIKNIAVLGVKTYGWTFMNRGVEIPGAPPYVRLTAPSGDTWEWNEPSDDNRVEGLATEFCRVVSQGRNIADTKLHMVGEPATQWMAIAQCFAGPPADPPAPGERAWD